MTHLSDADLQQWFARGAAADRERVLNHLADCEACRRALSLMAQEPIQTDGQPTLVPAHEVVDRGYAVYQPAERPAGGWIAWVRSVYGLAAVVGVVIAGVLFLRAPTPGDDSALRGSDLLAVAPVGVVGELREFRWASPIDAPRYRLVIQDGRGQQLYTGLTSDEHLTVTEDLRAQIVGQGVFTWHVDALDETGTVLARSRAASFRVGS